MTHETKQGMRLCQRPNPRENKNGWLLQTAAALLGCMSLLLPLTEFVGLKMGAAMIAMLAAGGYLCILYGLLGKFQKQNWFAPCVLVLVAVLVLVCRQQVQEGLRLFWNQLSDTRTAGTGWVLPEMETELDQQKASLCMVLFAVLTGSIAALISCLLVSSAAPVLAILAAGVMLGGMIFVGNNGSFRHLIPVLAAAAALLLCGGWEKKQTAAPALLSWIVCGAAACLLIAAACIPGVSSWAEQVGEQMHKAVHEHKYETEYTTLPEGDFTEYQTASDKAEAALVVTMDYPETMYLQGFAGCTFEGDTWKPLDTKLLAENKDLLYWLNLNAFKPNSQFSAAAAQAEMRENTITVQNIGACSRYLYVPFSLCNGEYLIPEDLNTDSVLSEGTRTYTYASLYCGENGIAQVLEHLQTSNEKTVLLYRKAESAYRGFVYNCYLQVPEDAKELLGQQWDKIADKYGSADNLTLQQAQECALLFLSKCFPEEGTPEDMELPLDIARGTSYQYATVAVLTLRYYGIPARYAEGYVITEQMAADAQSGGSIQVDGSCTRAWAEVYQDGIGWIPMELTQGIGEIIQEQPDDTQSDGEEKNESENKDAKDDQETETPEENTQKEEPEGGSVVRIAKAVLLGVLIVLLILLLLFLLLMLRRKLLLKRKEKKFQDENRKDAVAWIFADTALVLEKLGLDRGNGSMRELCEPAAARFGEEFAADLWSMIDLNDQAMFSSRELEETQRESALRFRSRTLQLLNTEVKWYKRLWLKWVQCLY